MVEIDAMKAFLVIFHITFLSTEPNFHELALNVVDGHVDQRDVRDHVPDTEALEFEGWPVILQATEELIRWACE